MRVLVVEDSRTLADALVDGLNDEGMAVDVAYDGLQAATKLDLNTYDVVVLDRDLPGLHGDTICRMITDREHPAMVLMLTASGTPAQRVSGLSLGADDYLSKPFHFPELVLRIRSLARRRPTAQPRIFRAAGIELDPLHHSATRDGRRLDLSAKEFALLEALMRAQHAVLSAEDLFARYGTSKTDPFTNTVHVTISRLRRKLGDPPSHRNHPQRRIPHRERFQLKPGAVHALSGQCAHANGRDFAKKRGARSSACRTNGALFVLVRVELRPAAEPEPAGRRRSDDWAARSHEGNRNCRAQAALTVIGPNLPPR